MDRTRSEPRFRLLAPLALASAAVATADLRANDVLLTQRVVQANGLVTAQSGPGPWNSSHDQGNASSWQVSYVDASVATADGASAAVGVGSSAKSTLLHIVSVTQTSVFGLQGYVAGYAETAGGFAAGDCSITLSQGGRVLFAAQSQQEFPYYDAVMFNASGEIEPGVYTLTITSASVGAGTVFGPSYASIGSYSVNFWMVPAACGGTEAPCLVPHATPGCDVESCCATICEADPFCCDVAWDVGCALAAEWCAISPPNDSCELAQPIADGDWVSNVGGSDEIELPRFCTDAEFSTLNAPTYYTYVASATGPLVIELGEDSTFDAMLAVYVGDCSDQVLIACDDDSSKQGASQPRVAFDVICGQTYTIVLGGYGSATGVARIAIDASGSCGPNCPADFNGDGLIGPTDLAELLGAWDTAFPTADLDGSGQVGASDLTILLGAWGLCP